MVDALAAHIADLDALVALEHTVFQTDRISRRQFRYLFSKGRALIVKAVAGEEMLGCLVLLFRRDSRRTRVYSLAVAARARRQGIARRLLAYAEAESRRMGMTGIVLEVREDNPAALALYQAAGFRLIGRRRNYYEDGQAAARLEKRLEEIAAGASRRQSVPEEIKK
ncbi:MAG: GNAT family N-acetyltransferase [Desulfobulbaceae bacterium]|jgi:ribosomal protein S18 acetylase RimI-like enzyme|nr:GNAT family N-acetyltransferase [Desulfobulbaceae bacterium]